jgi:hypothetical protein
VPTVRLSHLSEAEPTSSPIIGWREGRWDREILAIELQALVELSFDMQLTRFEPRRNLPDGS